MAELVKLFTNINRTIYWYIKHVALKEYVYQERFNLSNTAAGEYSVIKTDLLSPFPSDNGRGFCPFIVASGIFGECTSSGTVTAYDSLNIVSPSEYVVNYLNGSIYSNTQIVACDALWYYVAVVDEWPSGDIPTRPLVVITIKDITAQGFQLGGGKQPIIECILEVFGSSQAELKTITYTLFEALYLKSTKVYDFNNGDVLSYDGTFNTSFSCTSYNNPSVLYFEDVSVKYIRLKAYDMEDYDAYRAQVVFTGTAYIEA